jgi:hypothetical protein
LSPPQPRSARSSSCTGAAGGVGSCRSASRGSSEEVDDIRTVVSRVVIAVVVVLATCLLPAGGSAAAQRCFDPEHTLERRLMRGNLDGDGSTDEAWLGARRVDGRCRYYVFARTTSTGTSRVRLPASDRFSRSSLRRWARPIAFVRIDAVPGREVAVKLLEGASVRPFGFFTVRHGRIVRMDVDDTSPPLAADDMFAFGGGLALMFGTDCAYRDAPRTIVFSLAYRRGDGSRYVVERRWYQVQGDAFVRSSRPTEREVVRLAQLKRRFAEFRNGGLLPRCHGLVLDPRDA